MRMLLTAVALILGVALAGPVPAEAAAGGAARAALSVDRPMAAISKAHYRHRHVRHWGGYRAPYYAPRVYGYTTYAPGFWWLQRHHRPHHWRQRHWRHWRHW